MEKSQSDQGHPHKKPTQEPDTKHHTPHPSDYSPYPKLDPADVAPPSENWSNLTASAPRAPISGDATTAMPPESNPYVTPAPAPQSSVKSEFFFLGKFKYESMSPQIS